MNKRIKELSKQASYETSTAMFSHMSFKERFAELIVKECADCSYHMDKDSGPITADLIKIRIMSLFGEVKNDN